MDKEPKIKWNADDLDVGSVKEAYNKVDQARKDAEEELKALKESAESDKGLLKEATDKLQEIDDKAKADMITDLIAKSDKFKEDELKEKSLADLALMKSAIDSVTPEGDVKGSPTSVKKGATADNQLQLPAQFAERYGKELFEKKGIPISEFNWLTGKWEEKKDFGMMPIAPTEGESIGAS